MFQDVYANFHIEHLDNGLSIYLKEWPSASWFYAGVVIHAGARQDPTGRSGLAHLVEHLISKNVTPLTFSELERVIKSLGGEAWLGETFYASSEYKIHVPNDEQNIHQALDLFGQMLLLPKQLTQGIEEEKTVILREYHQRYEHEQARSWSLQGRPWLFENHPCLQSYHRPLGTPDGFLGSSRQDIQAFYDAYYVPQNCSLICIGSLERRTLLHIVEDTPFSVQRAGQRNLLPGPFFPTFPQKREQIVHLSEYSQLTQWEAEISLGWVLPLHFERRCIQLFCDLFEQRLTEELRYQRQLTYGVDVGSTYYQDCWTLHVTWKTAPASVGQARDIVWHVLHSLDREEEKLSEIRQETVWSIRRMDYSGYDLLESAMGDLAAYQRLITFTEELQQIEGTTFEQVVELARYLTYERHFCFLLLP